MRGAPWEGLFYAFVLEAVVGVGAVVFALQEQDFLGRAVAWAVAATVVVLAVRTVRRALRLGDDPGPPTGRWWFGG